MHFGCLYRLGSKKTPWFYILAILSAICTHLTLFNALILPGIIGVYLLIFRGFPMKWQTVREYLKILCPFMLITVVYLYIYFFVFTTLSTSSYYNLEESLLVRFGKYVFDYITLWPHYFFRITYNEKLLPYLGTIMVVVFMVAFF